MATFLPDHGYLVMVRAQSMSGNIADYDVTATSNPNWYNLFGVTSDIGVFSFAYNPSGIATTPTIPTKTIPLAVREFVFRLLFRNQNWTSDVCDMDWEFLDAGGSVVAALRIRGNSLKNTLQYGASLASLATAAQVGTNPLTFGNLSFTDSALVYTSDTGTNRNQSFTFACNVLAIKSVRFSNLKAQSNRTEGSGEAHALISILSAPAGWDGNFAALTAAEYTALNPDLLLPAGSAIGHAQGVGLTASGTAPSYVLSRGVLPGQTGVLLDSNNQVVARLSYLAGVASLTVGGVTTSAPCTLPYLSLVQFNGQVFGYYQTQVIVRSTLFVTGANGQNWVELQPGESLASIDIEWIPLGGESTYLFTRIAMTATVANQEPRSQFQPQDVAWRGGEGAGYSGPMPAVAVTTDPLCQGQDLTWVRDGNQNVLHGYIESTVTIDGEGVRRRVLCLDQAGNLIGETYSRASDGKYRFDLLWLNRRYMLVAQDDPAFGPADYNAVAADFQLPTPYAPGEGVGLA